MNMDIYSDLALRNSQSPLKEVGRKKDLVRKQKGDSRRFTEEKGPKNQWITIKNPQKEEEQADQNKFAVLQEEEWEENNEEDSDELIEPKHKDKGKKQE